MSYKLRQKNNILTTKTYIIYGIGVAYAILDQIYNQWLSYYYLPPASETDLKPLLQPVYLVIAYVFARLIDSISDPVIGYMSDNSKSKFGKRSIFIVIGALPLGIFMTMYFYPIKTSQIATFFYLTINGALFFIAYTLVAAPYNALIPDLASNKEERLNLSTYQSLFRLIYTGIALVLPALMINWFGNGNTELGLRKTIIILSIVSITLVYLSVYFLKENKMVKIKKEYLKYDFIDEKDTIIKENNEFIKVSFSDSIKYLYERNIIFYFLGYLLFFSGFNILRGVMTYYVVLIMNERINMVSIVSFVLFGVAGLFFPITNKYSRKYSYKKILIINILLLIISTIGLLFFRNNFLVYLMFIICGIGLSGSAFIFPQAMLSELSVKLYEKKRVNLEGFLFGIQGLFLKISFLIQQIILSTVIVVGSKKNSISYPTATGKGVKMTLVISIIFFIMSLIIYSLTEDDK